MQEAKKELRKFLDAERLLGSHIYYGIIIGLVAAGLTLYFLSLAIPIGALIGVGIGIILICTILGFALKKRVKILKIKIFEKWILRSFFSWIEWKLELHNEDINRKRIFIESLVSRYLYINTLHPDMQQWL